MTSTLDHAWLESHIPHKAAMCLLDAVTHWDEDGIHCRATSHRSDDNPLRSGDRLNTVAGVEYAAQAMAAHGALTAEDAGAAKVGYLVSLRGVHAHVGRLDDISADLDVEAQCITRTGSNVLYEFRVSAQGRLLLEGRAAVVLDASSLTTN